MVAPLGAVTKRERGAPVKTQAKKGSNGPVRHSPAGSARRSRRGQLQRLHCRSVLFLGRRGPRRGLRLSPLHTIFFHSCCCPVTQRVHQRRACSHRTKTRIRFVSIVNPTVFGVLCPSGPRLDNWHVLSLSLSRGGCPSPASSRHKRSLPSPPDLCGAGGKRQRACRCHPTPYQRAFSMFSQVKIGYCGPSPPPVRLALRPSTAALSQRVRSLGDCSDRMALEKSETVQTVVDSGSHQPAAHQDNRRAPQGEVGVHCAVRRVLQGRGQSQSVEQRVLGRPGLAVW